MEETNQAKKYSLLKEFKKFIINNKLMIIITTIVCLVSYGIKLLGAVGIDTELQMETPGFMSDIWYNVGRFTAAIATKIFNLIQFEPFFAFGVTIVCMVISSIVWCFLFHLIYCRNSDNKLIYWIFPAAFFSAPIMAEQYYFTLQSLQFTVGFLTCGISLIFVFRWIQTNYFGYMLLSIPFAVWAFGTYQSLALIYIAGSICLFILLYQSQKEGQSFSRSFYRNTYLRLILIALIDFVIYQITNKIVQSFKGASPYIENMIQWGQKPATEIFNDLNTFFFGVFSGEGIYYSKTFIVFIAVAVIYLAWNIKNKHKGYVWYVISYVGLILSPFLIIIMSGATIAIRTQIGIPFVVAFLMMFLVSLFPQHVFKKKLNIRFLSCSICAILIYTQTAITARLNYTDYIRYQQDVALCHNITNDIYSLDLGEYPSQPVVYIGNHQSMLNQSCYPSGTTEMIGKSLFNWYNILESSSGSEIVNKFMSIQGYNFKSATKEQIEQARYLSDTMPSYPNQGYVQEKNDIIIVKLSPDIYLR